jgi:hypothetical protein
VEAVVDSVEREEKVVSVEDVVDSAVREEMTSEVAVAASEVAMPLDLSMDITLREVVVREEEAPAPPEAMPLPRLLSDQSCS